MLTSVPSSEIRLLPIVFPSGVHLIILLRVPVIADISEVPLPLTTPVSVPTPVPPRVTSVCCSAAMVLASDQ